MTCAALSGVDGQSDWSSAVESPYSLPAAPPLGAAHCAEAVLTERGNAARWVASREATETAFGGQPERFPVPRSASTATALSADTGGDQ